MTELGGMILGAIIFSIISIISYFFASYLLVFFGVNEIHIIPLAVVSGFATAIGCHCALIVQTNNKI